MSNELTDVRCPCGAEFQADSYDAGFIAGSGMCQNCDAALPPKDICTCPSGDGSLRHPCPAHPAVEQAGGDEGVKCAVCVDSGKVYDISGEGPWKCYACTGSHEVIGYANGDELDNMLDDRTAVLSPVKTSFHTVPVYREARTALAQPSPAQAEAERPEVVGYRVSMPDEPELGHWLEEEAESEPQIQHHAPLMTVAQHERIVAFRWERAMDLMGEHVARISEKFKAERDAALAEVERLRQSKGDPSGSFDRCMKMMYERDENAKQLEVALARVAELEKQEPVAWVEVIDRDYGPYNFHGKRLLPKGKHQLYAAPVSQAQQLHDLDKQCRDDVARALGLRPNQERGFAWSYLLASIKSCVKASGDSAQAQHSVPEGFREKFKQCMELAFAEIAYYVSPKKARDPNSRARKAGALATELHAMLAAAPGNSVPQAWLDVQAERRRQVDAEGWTPEHDDEHSHGQMARAAACYALAGSSAPNDETAALLVSLAWPWDQQWWKPTSARRDLVKACALAMAEIERMDRAAAPGKEGNDD